MYRTCNPLTCTRTVTMIGDGPHILMFSPRQIQTLRLAAFKKLDLEMCVHLYNFPLQLRKSP
jgi:hypothetical protein